MKQLILLVAALVLATTFSACSESKKSLTDIDEFTTDIDTAGYDEDLAGDKDDLFAEGPQSDDSPVVTDNVVPTDGDDLITDETGNDEIVTDEVPDEDGPIGPDGQQPDVDLVIGTCDGGTYRLTASVYHREGNQSIPGGGSLAFSPVGAADSEGNLACYQPNATVTMTLTLETDYTFGEWRGPDGADVQGEFPTFTILMDADKSVRALVIAPIDPDADIVVPDFPQPDVDVVEETCPAGFKLAPYVYYQQGPQQIVGGGSIAMDPAGSDSSLGNPVCYTADTTVNMTVTVDEGYTWDQWRGADRLDVTGTFPNFSIVVDADKDVRARVAAN